LSRNHWLIVLGIALLTILCCYLATCTLTGFFWRRAASLPADLVSAPTLESEPTPVLTPAWRQPSAEEWKTADTVAHAALPERDLVDLAYRLLDVSSALTEPLYDQPPSYDLGDAETFWIHNVNSNAFFTATAFLQYETPHAYWWIERDYHIPETDLEQAAWKFEHQTYPTNQALFGEEWNPGIDGDPHIYIFLGKVPGVGGYYSSPDEYSAYVRARSNEHEMFYINLDNAQPGNDYFDGILAHEFQHMIHWAVDRDEDTWVNEGLSELAGHVNGYDVGGSDWLFTSTPDTQLTTWPELEDSGPHYGASYLFLTYFMDQYGEDAIRQLVEEPANGITGFDATLARVDPGQRRFKDLFSDWVIANYLQDPDLADGRYGYKSLQLDRPRHAAHHTDYPVEQQTTVHQYAADYILIEGDRPLTVEFRGSLVVPLVGNEAHSGEFQWWAVRGDEGDATLTRAFDLGAVTQATLQVWMWYDLEAEYDYAYVEVSTDGGRTWDLLSNADTTVANPSGNSYGPAFTGQSGNGEHARWVHETFDLTPYAGRLVLVRFEVVTDDAVNHRGFCVDDISIPELNYDTDVESGPDGWQAGGWLRVTSHVPQEFDVQLITIGEETHVERISLDRQMRGKMRIAGLGQDIDRAVLVVSALAPSTTESVAYTYQIVEE
jgi:immune inhibitor A